MDIKLQFSWLLTHNEANYHVDPLLFELLEAIQSYGSLKKATEHVGVSYRFAWGLLTKWEAIFNQPLVHMARGQGTRLGNIGEKLMHANRQLNANYSPQLANFSTQLRSELIPLLIPSRQNELKIFASHGLAISALRDIISRQSDFKLGLHFHGSLESLRSLNANECDIAGFHIPEGKLGQGIKADYLTYLSPEKHTLIYIIKRNQGLMLAPNNPKKITKLSDLISAEIRFVNRQSESGTRLLFDQLLTDLGIQPEQIEGYRHEEFTHMAVAAMVASGAADAGFGIAPIADKFNLDFIPMVWEHYCLAVPSKLMQDERVKQILTLLKAETFIEQLQGLNGYQTQLTGEIVSFEAVFG